jgi:hypothetical protein
LSAKRRARKTLGADSTRVNKASTTTTRRLWDRVGKGSREKKRRRWEGGAFLFTGRLGG